MTKPKTISNVLLCSKDNNLRLADIIFDDKIIDINYKIPKEIKWSEISTKDSWQAYYFARDERAEALTIIKMINIARQTGCKIHIVHLSSQFGVELIRQAKNEGLNVSADTCPHYLYFIKDDFDNPEISNYLKMAPPVKTEYDRLSLWEAITDGTLEFMTTDHAGCDPEKAKKGNDFWQIYGGIPSVEHRVPFLISEGFKTW